ncbi:MAG: hypothetical protein H6964_06505 [Chromatiaceae bacterium]|nr:hypothetical protein [Chromatiaceae bacterium]MCP5446630.1 hypothetical protein [Chromatiaceae bacterium]
MSQGHEVTVVSRNPNIPERTARAINSDRLNGLRQLKKGTFDATIDFICSSGQDVDDVYKYLDPGLYVLISTVWLAKREGNKELFPHIPEITERYLQAKRRAEEAVSTRRSQGYPGTSLRLPIQSGVNDHTRRLLFYLDRIADDSGIILINGGTNCFQLVNNEDVASALSKALLMNVLGSIAVWDAMPDYVISVKEMIRIMAGKKEVSMYDISDQKLAGLLPEYLDQEPFWQEHPLSVLDNNLFQITESVPRKLEEWIMPLRELTRSLEHSHLRQKEIVVMQNLLKHELK